MARVLVNEAIVADEVLLEDEHGAVIGLRSRTAALALARERGCDLVQDGVFSSPPRCRLAPAARSAAQSARAGRMAAGSVPKEIRVSTSMGAHDLEARKRQAANLLAKGYTVKLAARLARTERANPVAARALLERMARDLASAGTATRKPFNESGALSLLVEP